MTIPPQANSADSIDWKQRLSNLSAEEVTGLQDAHLYYVRRRWLRTDGWLNVFLGLLTIMSGTYVGTTPLPIRYQLPLLIQTIAGIVIVILSFWAIVRPDNQAIFRFSILFLAAGSWNIFLVLFLGSSWLVGLLGLLQIRWAYQFRAAYRRYRELNLVKPSSIVAQLYKDTWTAIIKTGLKKDADSLRIWVGSGISIWFGLLAGDYAFLAYRRPRMLIVQRQSEFVFAPNSARAFSKRRVYGRLKLGTPFDTSDRALMNRTYYHRYAHWKGETAPTEIAPTWFQRLPRLIRILIMIVVGVIVAYIVFITIGAIDLMIRYS